MRLRYLFILLELLALPAHGQIADSLQLDPVAVYGWSVQNALPGSHVQYLDSIAMAEASGTSLGDLLQNHTAIFFKNYGPGMLSAVGLRGLSASQTQVLWEGFELKSFTLGQTDFSTLPSVAFDEVSVQYGGGSALLGSGAIGGSILLQSKIPEKAPFTLGVKQQIGCFQTYYTGLQGTFHSGKWRGKTVLWHQQSENDFPLPHDRGRQPHAAWNQQGLMQQVQFVPDAHQKITLHAWLQHQFREVQPVMGVQNAKDEQVNDDQRFTATYENQQNQHAWKLGMGYFDETLNYNDDPARVKRLETYASSQWNAGKWGRWKVGLRQNHVMAKVSGYGKGLKNEDRWLLHGGVSKRFGPLRLSLMVGKPLLKSYATPFTPYLGMKTFLWQNSRQSLQLRVALSRDYRLPTLNDRFWQDGGNPDIRPEQSNNAELGLDFHTQAPFPIRLSVQSHYQVVVDWIQWQPDSTNTWRPVNYQEVTAKGLSTMLELTPWQGAFTWKVLLQHQWNNTRVSDAPSQESLIGKQLVYSPKHTLLGKTNWEYQQWRAELTAHYTGAVFTTSDNDPIYALPGFATLDINFSRKVSWKNWCGFIQGRVENVTDKRYQSYYNYAMPGRAYQLTLSIQYQKPTKHEP